MRTTALWDQNSTLLTSFNLNHLSKGHISKYSKVRSITRRRTMRRRLRVSSILSLKLSLIFCSTNSVPLTHLPGLIPVFSTQCGWGFSRPCWSPNSVLQWAGALPKIFSTSAKIWWVRETWRLNSGCSLLGREPVRGLGVLPSTQESMWQVKIDLPQ